MDKEVDGRGAYVKSIDPFTSPTITKAGPDQQIIVSFVVLSVSALILIPLAGEVILQ